MLLCLAAPPQAKAIDLRLKIVPVAEAVDALAKAGGLRLETDKKVAERKITVLVSHADAKETMARIADVMRLAWEKEKDGVLRLVIDTALENRERSHVEAERAARKTALRREIEKKAALGATPVETLRRRMALAKAKMDGNGPDAMLAFETYTELDWFLLGDRTEATALAVLGTDGRRRLLAGEPMLFSAGSRLIGIRLPLGVLQSGSEAMETNEAPVKRVTLLLQTDEDGTALESMSAAETEDGGGQIGGPATDLGLSSEPEGMPQTAFLAEMKAWDTKVLTGPAAARRLDPKTPVRPSEWRKQAMNDDVQTDADRLEWLHDAAGIDVVARADRVVSGTSDPFAHMSRPEGVRPRPQMGMTFQGTVAEFVANWRRRTKDYFRMTNSVLMMRPAVYWSRTNEPPESFLRLIEAKKSVSLEDWVAFSSSLRPAQAVDLSNGRLAVRRRMDGLAALPALRLWVALTAGQRAEARNRPLRAANLTSAQLALFRRGVLEATRYGAFMPNALAGVLTNDLSKVAFEVDAGENSLEGPILSFGFGDAMSFDVPIEDKR